jgi:hypothetical protein
VAPAFQNEMGLACIRERDHTHLCPQLAIVDQVCDFRQVLAYNFDEKARRAASKRV